MATYKRGENPRPHNYKIIGDNMQCSECPYGEYDYTRRVNIYDAIVAEQGIPNDVYGDMSRDEAIEQAEEYCWCDKVGGKVI